MEYKEYPFIFINHGKPLDIYSFQGEKYISFCFRDNVPDADKKKIEKLAPKLLKGSFLWSENMLLNYSATDEDEIIMHYMMKRKQGLETEMDNKLMFELYSAFADDIEKWAVESDKISPLYYFTGFGAVGGSAWDSYSSGKIPEITGYIENQISNADARSRGIFVEMINRLRYDRPELSSELKIKLDELEKTAVQNN